MKRTKPILTYTCFNCYSQIQDQSSQIKNWTKFLTPFQHSNQVKITYYQKVFFQKVNIELISTVIYSLMSNADKIMNKINMKYAILIPVNILHHQSAYLNILVSTLKLIFNAINRVFPQNLYLQDQVYYNICNLFEQDVYGIIFLMFYALS